METYPPKIGVLLRDKHGVPRVGYVTGRKFLRILKKNGLTPEISEDLYHLIKYKVPMRKHLKANNKNQTQSLCIFCDLDSHTLWSCKPQPNC